LFEYLLFTEMTTVICAFISWSGPWHSAQIVEWAHNVTWKWYYLFCLLL